MSGFFRFPHTPHLAWLGEGEPRGDKVLPADQVAELLAGELVVEEKVDGANLGFSPTEAGHVRVQNRGSYLDPQAAHPQFRPLWSWLAARESTLAAALWPDLILFGEWCFAVHSVEYDRLPDWFLGFDLYDRQADAFWDTERRDALLRELGLDGVPLVARGRFSLPQLEQLVWSKSLLGGSVLEGIVVRRESGGCTTARAKLVNPRFTQAIDVHWSRGPLRRNHLVIRTEPES